MKNKKIYLITAARPNFIKLAPVWRALNHRSGIDAEIVHTGQHYDYGMSKVFFDELGLPEPDYNLGVGSGLHGSQTAKILTECERLFIEQSPDIVVVFGDVNSTLAASLAAVKLGIPIAHVEAGLRSFDMKMPEEINRILTDRISDLLFTTESSADVNLANEGVAASKVHLVGNVMIDTLAYLLDRIKGRDTAQEMGLVPGEFAVSTIHRPSNVDTEASLMNVYEILLKAAERAKVIFPAHPRTIKSLKQTGLLSRFEAIENLTLIEPLGYLEFMNLVYNSQCVLTDSGGIQEETTFLGIPCITLRENTERPITVEEGTNRITGLDIAKVSEALPWASSFDRTGYSPPALWDGKAARRIAGVISSSLEKGVIGGNYK